MIFFENTIFQRTLIKHGKVKRAGLGIVLVPDRYRRRIGLEGALILEVQRKSAGDKAGLKPTRRNAFGDVVLGDLIISVDDQPIKKNEDLVEYLDKNKEIGDKVKLRFIREKKEFGTTARLQELKK